MKLLDIIKISQKNLLRSKLRTLLTVGAVFIGALTLSLTNGLGNGVKSYVNDQLGNLGVEHTLMVHVKQSQQNPVSTDVTAYNPDREVGTFNIALLNQEDFAKIEQTEGVIKITPERMPQLEYIGHDAEKFEVAAYQNLEGLNLTISEGERVREDLPNGITIPHKYVEPLGFSDDHDSLGKTVTLAYKNAAQVTQTADVTIIGVQEPSILGNTNIVISQALAKLIVDDQTKGVPALEGKYMNAVVKFDASYSDEDIAALKQRFEDQGYAAQTIQDQIGIISTVIDTILIVLNVFGVITLIAAAFGIVNTQLMSVNERTSEIGLMKALGASRRNIFTMFSIEAASIGFWGAALGTLVSIVIGTLVSGYATNNFLKDFVGFQLLSFPIVSTAGVVLAIMCLSFLAGALPSLKASRLDPIKALRHE
ncbi:MAG: FtsX-like permease family protein [Patescibacteria group bacterium]